MAFTVPLPLVPPLHDTFVPAIVHAILPVDPTKVVHVEVHPLLSVVVTVYVPPHNPLMLAVVAALLHKYVYVGVPPVAVTVAVPLQTPQAAAVEETLHVNAAGCVMVTEHVVVHPLAEVTVAVYVPAANPVLV